MTDVVVFLIIVVNSIVFVMDITIIIMNNVVFNLATTIMIVLIMTMLMI